MSRTRTSVVLVWVLAALGPVFAAVAGVLAAGAGSWWPAVAVAAAAAVAAAVLAVMLQGKLIRPLDRLLEGCTRISGGDLHARVAMENPPEFVVTVRDALERLRSELGFYQGIVKGMATPCVVVDAKEVLRFTNRNLLHILQHEGKPEDFYGQNVAHFFYGDATRKTVLSTAMEEGHEITREVELTGRKGAKRNIRIDASAIYDFDGTLLGALCVYADLTELRAKQAQLEAHNAAVAAAGERADGVSRHLAEAASRLTGMVEDARRGADRQNDRTTSTATAMEEMNATVLEVARNAENAASKAEQAGIKAREGSSVVERSVSAISDVSRLTEALKQSLGKLSEQAQSIGQIMSVIGDIADQTNLLALNAAIEAARAGDAGRGFAVVADEVRKLAEKTMTATKEVGGAVGSIQGVMRESVASMEEAAGAVTRATSLAGQSGQALGEIVRIVADTSDQVRSIATAAEQQSATSEEINRAVDDIREISIATSEEMGQAARAVAELAGMAKELEEVIRSIRS